MRRAILVIPLILLVFGFALPQMCDCQPLPFVRGEGTRLGSAVWPARALLWHGMKSVAKDYAELKRQLET